MKNLPIFLALIFITGAVFAKGEIYLQNVGQQHLGKGPIRFKLVIKDSEEQIVNEIYTPILPPKYGIVIMSEQLKIKNGTIDCYIENATNDSGFKKCNISGYPYNVVYHVTRIGAWHDGQNYDCTIMEDG